LSKVDTVRFLVDDRCNYACWYCSRKPDVSKIHKLTSLLKGIGDKLELELKFPPRDTGVVDPQGKHAIVTDIFDFSKYDKAIITGGEPLMWPSEMQLLTLQAASGCSHVTVETNGLMLDQQKAEKLQEWGAHKIEMNLYLKDAAFKQIDNMLEIGMATGIDYSFATRSDWTFLEAHYPGCDFSYFDDWTLDSRAEPFKIPDNEIAVMWKKEV
jgi:molybdenum cofactor biosynthesis enzyme MoaA